MCTEGEPKTIAKKATVTTALGMELSPVTVMGPPRKVQVGLTEMYEVRLYGQGVPKKDSPWVVVKTVQDRNQREILL